MKRDEVVAALVAERVVPVLRYESAELTEKAVRCLVDVGFRCIEITLTTPGALALIRSLSQEKGLVVGAGTVLDAGAGEECIDAGAQFVVAPYVCPGLARAAHDAGRAALIAGFTPTEVMAAHREGADVVKVFPASSGGGPAHLAHLRAVYPHILFCPTGGVTLENVEAFIAAGATFVGTGAVVPAAALRRNDLGAVRVHAATYKGKKYA